MQHVDYHLDPELISSLTSIVGERWDSVGTANRIIGDLITCPALLVTNLSTVAITILDNEVFIGGEYETLTQVARTTVDDSLKKAQKQGTLFFHGKGEQVTSVHIIREELVKISGGIQQFKVSTDSGVVVCLETMVLALQRRGFHGFDFKLLRAPTLEEINFYPSEFEWPLNLNVTYEYSRNLIQATRRGGE